MNNPFINISEKGSKFIDTHCSINRLIIKKLPVYGIEDEIEGMNAKAIFSTKTIVNEIRTISAEHGIDVTNLYDSQIPVFLEEELKKPDGEFYEGATKIIRKFGHRLGLILLTLKTGLPENRMVREDWNDEHWEFYKGVKNIIIVGGLANGIFGEKLREYAMEVFEIAKIEPYNLIFFENASHFGVLGCGKMVREAKSYNVVFDFGQTNIKRCIVRVDGDCVYTEKELENRPSWFMMDDIEDKDVLLGEAYKLHNNLMTVIADTFRMARENYKIGNDIVISIASYTVDGKLNDVRGGYAKLTLLTSNYQEYLQNDLRKLLKRNVNIKLVHDGTAMAHYFSDYKDTVCFSIGTAFGVGFPDM